MGDPAADAAEPAGARANDVTHEAAGLQPPSPCGKEPVGGDAGAALEAGRVLFAGECRFVRAVQSIEALPPVGVAEVAFAGRSNVGKSSLLNALTGRRALARVSGMPGRTQQLVFFDLSGRLMLVDLPGYGYAQAPKSVQADWQGLMFDYLRGRPNLRRVLLLLDARVEVKASDVAAMQMLDRAAVTFQLVLTKADSVRPPALAAKEQQARALARAHSAAHPEVITTSSATALGMAALRAVLADLAE